MKLTNHFFTADFTDVAAFLGTKPNGFVFKGASGHKLAEVLKLHDRRPSTQQQWSCGPEPAPLNVHGGVVVYNGPNSSLYRTNSRFDRVMVVALPHHGDDRLYLQYNEE